MLISLDQEDLERLNLKLPNAWILNVGSSSDSSIQIRGLLLLGGLETAPDEDLLRQVGEHARLLVQRDILNQIELDSNRGGLVQKRLLPGNDVVVPAGFDLAHRFIPARGLAGDYFDVLIQPRTNRLVLAIADVSGKGVGPSLYGMTSKTILRELLKDEDLAPHEVLDSLNKAMCAESFGALFLTMFLAIIDPDTGRLDYASAGHNKMLLLRTNPCDDLPETEELSAKGIPLGIMDSVPFESKEIQLQEEDSLVLYTDGVIELENPSLELYDMPRLVEFCSRNKTMDATSFDQKLLQELDEFRAGVYSSDDITYLICKWRKDGW